MDLYDKLKSLLGSFIIEKDDVKLSAKLELVKGKYILGYDGIIYDSLAPFLVVFYDLTDYHYKDYNATIENIHKTDEYSGTQIVNTLLYFLKNIGVKRVVIGDDTHVNCNGTEVDLSLYLLLDRGMTYYQRFGFDTFIKKNSSQWAEFGTKKNMKKALDICIKKLDTLKIKEVLDGYIKIFKLMSQVVLEQGYQHMTVLKYNKVLGYNNDIQIHPNDMSRFVRNKISGTIYMINALSSVNPKMSIREYIIHAFHNNCTMFNEIIGGFIYGKVYHIQYKKTKLINKYVEVFHTLYLIRNCVLELVF